MGQTQPVSFCTACELKIIFMFFSGWKKIKRRIIFCDTCQLCEVHISVFINKGLLESSHAKSMYVLSMAACVLPCIIETM